MTNFAELASVTSDCPVQFTDRLRLAVAAYLARFRGSSREHTASDLRCYLTWCAERDLDPLAARRPHLELYIRWMQEVRRFKPSTISRRFSVAAGFYRTCVTDGVLEHSPAEHVRRPPVPAESPTLGFTHLQFEALLTAARESPSDCDFALAAMLGAAGPADLRGHRRGHLRPGRRTRPPGPARVRQGQQGRPGPAATSCRSGHRPRDRYSSLRAHPAQQPRHPDGPPRRHPPPPPARRSSRSPDHPAAPAHAPPYVRDHHLDAGVDLRDVQIAARH